MPGLTDIGPGYTPVSKIPKKLCDLGTGAKGSAASFKALTRARETGACLQCFQCFERVDVHLSQAQDRGSAKMIFHEWHILFCYEINQFLPLPRLQLESGLL